MSEYSYEEACELGPGVRFMSMRRIPIDNMAHARFMFPVRPGEPGYEDARYEVVEVPAENTCQAAGAWDVGKPEKVTNSVVSLAR